MHNILHEKIEHLETEHNVDCFYTLFASIHVDRIVYDGLFFINHRASFDYYHRNYVTGIDYNHIIEIPFLIDFTIVALLVSGTQSEARLLSFYYYLLSHIGTLSGARLLLLLVGSYFESYQLAKEYVLEKPDFKRLCCDCLCCSTLFA